MSWRATAAVKSFLMGEQAESLSSSHAAILYCLADECQDDFCGFPSLDRLGRATRLSRRALIINLKELAEFPVHTDEGRQMVLGVETRFRENGRQTSNLYTLNLPPAVILREKADRPLGAITRGAPDAPSPSKQTENEGGEGAPDARGEGAPDAPSTMSLAVVSSEPYDNSCCCPPKSPQEDGGGGGDESWEEAAKQLQRLGIRNGAIDAIRQRGHTPGFVISQVQVFTTALKGGRKITPGLLASVLLHGGKIDVEPDDPKKPRDVAKTWVLSCCDCGATNRQTCKGSEIDWTCPACNTPCKMIVREVEPVPEHAAV